MILQYFLFYFEVSVFEDFETTATFILFHNYYLLSQKYHNLFVKLHTQRKVQLLSLEWDIIINGFTDLMIRCR